MDDVDYGFRRVPWIEKRERVQRVFESVAGRYDLMNDLMSLGLHRLWKRFAVAVSGARTGDRILDLAGGTGDCAALYRRAVDPSGSVTVCDVNAAMLRRGRDRLLDRGQGSGIVFVQGDAECLPFPRCAFNRINIAFGLRNVTDRTATLADMLRCLEFGGCAVITEFSPHVMPVLQRIYDRYSLDLIPRLGELVAGDRDSYRYLVESIRVFPGREELSAMMRQAGFGRVECFSLSGGIVTAHRGYRL